MRTKHAEALFFLLGVASVVTAVVMTVGSMLSVPERERHLDQLLTTLDDLARIRASLVDDEAAILRYEHLPETRPTDLAALAGRTAPGVAVDIQRREHKELGQGWVRNRMHVVFQPNRLARPRALHRQCGATTTAVAARRVSNQGPSLRGGRGGGDAACGRGSEVSADCDTGEGPYRWA